MVKNLKIEPETLPVIINAMKEYAAGHNSERHGVLAGILRERAEALLKVAEAEAALEETRRQNNQVISRTSNLVMDKVFL